MRPGTLLRLRALKKIFAREISRDSVVLDIGSYDGAVSDQFQKLVAGLDITVVDVDESGLQLARKKIAEVNSQWGHVRPGYSLQQLEDLFCERSEIWL